MAQLGYRPELDGVRALAVAAVIGYHAEIPGFRGGGVGVTWFFVLSGFLITVLLLEEHSRFGAIDVPKFFARRALRLLPPLYLMLGTFLVISVTWASIDWREFVSTAFYFANMHPLVFGRDAEQPFFLHTWSLSLEEQYYLVWPFALRCLRTPRAGIGMGAVLIVAAFVARSFLDEPYDLLTAPIFNFDGFVIGAFLALGFRSGRLAVLDRPWLAAAAGAVMAIDVVVTSADPVGMVPVRVLASELAVAIVLWHLVTRPESRAASLLRLRPLVYIGLLSYALYLWHFPIFELLTAERAPDLWRPARHVLKFALTIAAAMFTYHFLDRPFGRLRARMRPSVAPAASPHG